MSTVHPPPHENALPAAARPRSAGAWIGRVLLVILAILVVVGIIGFIKVRQINAMMALVKSGAFDPPPVAVTTVVVQPAQWQPTLQAIGSLEAVQGVTVSADLPGIVKEIRFESGATVKAGDILVRLGIDQELAQLAAAEAQRDLAAFNLNRQRDLRAKNTNSQSDFDNADANQRQMEAMVANARAAIDRKTIRAPFSGVLGIRRASVGQYLNNGDPVVPLQSMDPIYVNFSLPQQNLADFGVGSEVAVRTDATGDAVFNGKVTAINALVDSATRNFQAQATLTNESLKLRPGMYAKVEVILPGGSKDMLPVPASAINYAPYGNSVFVLVHNLKIPADPNDPTSREKILPLAVRQQFVKTGATRGDLVAVTSGLKPGDEIVSSGVFKLQNSGAVKINNTVKPAAEENPNPPET